MGIASLNKGNKFSINTEGFEYKTLDNLNLNTNYTLRGVYILPKRGKMRQDMPNAILDDCIVNLPAHLLDDVKAILESPEFIEQIESKKAGFSVYEYEDENGKHRSIKWLDL